MNDRALRQIVCSLGGVANGFPRRPGSTSPWPPKSWRSCALPRTSQDLEAPRRHDRGLPPRPTPVYCRDIKADGAMTVLLKDAMQPNLCRRWKTTRPSCMAARSPTSPTAATR
jgi:formate--tetrahydrofolate ligase